MYKEAGIVFPKSSGESSSLFLVLQDNLIRTKSRYGPSNQKAYHLKPFTPFKIAIHDPFSVADLGNAGVSVEPGTISTILITPSQIITTSTSRSLGEERRACRFKYENDGLEIFKIYTQTSCLFECQLKVALDKCEWVPWDFPHPGKIWPVCDLWGRYCFKKLMESKKTPEECKCPYDCTTVRYSYSVSSIKMDPVQYCNDTRSEQNSFLK